MLDTIEGLLSGQQRPLVVVAHAADAAVAAGGYLPAIDPAAIVHLGDGHDLAERLPAVVERLAARIEEGRIEGILAQAYEGGHPDHDACAFATRAACLLVERRRGRAPLVLEVACHGAFLPGGPPQRACLLEAATLANKRRLVEACPTCPALSGDLALERYRVAPAHDFTRPPHPGQLRYEAAGAGDGRRWRERMRQAALALDLLPLVTRVAVCDALP
jgi:hypothetical protein